MHLSDLASHPIITTSHFESKQHTDIEESKPAWLSYMLYLGGLTFAPNKTLCIPNLVAARRFVKAILERYRIQVCDVTGALQTIVTTGDISNLLGVYKRMMCLRDIGRGDLKNKGEEHHRDSIAYTLLRNPLLHSTTEFEVSWVSG